MRGLIAVLGLATLLAGCASSAVLVGKARPAISPDAVRIYLTPPAKYEEVALLTASSEMSWAITEQGKMNAVMQGLKEEAAKYGANGILLRQTGDKSVGGVMVAPSAGGTFMASTYAIENKTGTGVAIYVPETN